MVTEGRVNAFGSYAVGDEFPNIMPGVLEGPFGTRTRQGDPAGDILAARVRSGFLSNVLAFGVRKKLSETVTLRGYFALWGSIESSTPERTRYSRVEMDVRQGFLELSGPFGALLVGRNLGLFSRASVEINYTYQHAWGLGNPCGVDGNGPTCGHIGFGVLYPGFDPGIVYSTPSLAGLKLTVGIYDPIELTAYFRRTPFPRPEAELVFERKFASTGFVKLFTNALWQRNETYREGPLPTLGPNAGMPVKNDAWGVGGGGRFELGPFRLGGTYYYGVGLGTHYPIQHSPTLFSPHTFAYRTFDGFYGTTALVFGRLQLHGGFGLARVHRLPEDIAIDSDMDGVPTPEEVGFTVPKQQYGIFGGFSVRITDALYANLDVFRAHSEWHGNWKQDLLFVNTGVTMTW